jgi:DNA-binding NtrC family response regulator
VCHYQPASQPAGGAAATPAGFVSPQALTPELIRHTLEHFGGNRRLAASALNISERTLYRRLKDLDIAA